MAVVGGMRMRLVKDSFYLTIHKALSDLGWMSSSPAREDVKLITEQYDTTTEITPNTVGIASEDLVSFDLELGSNFEENRWMTFIDVYAEDEAIGIQLAGDIYDILRGKISSIGRTDAMFEVWDWSSDPVFYLFNCHIENIEIMRQRDWDKPYQKYWWVIACDIIDVYYDDEVG